ncbi:hypothetical protein BGZ54_005347, partial [Gamsiella multidivaricata]
TAAIVIESIWPPLPGSSECPQRQKGLPLRTFIQETLKRSRSSYSTLQTALFYLYKIRNKVPCAYLKRRQDQIYQTHQILSAAQPMAGLVTPPASPHHLQSTTDFSHSLQASDYFSLRAPSDPKAVLPSPLSSTCSMASASPTSAALMVASKYLQDRNYSNKAWAKISGLSIKEINANELIFLKLIDYSLFVSHDTFMRWTALLVAHGQEATRKFMQTADVAHASAFAARTLSTPPMVLNGSHIRYGPSRTAPAAMVLSPPSEKDDDSKNVYSARSDRNCAADNGSNDN